MVDILDEIQEDIRRDRLNLIWKRYGKIIIALLVAIIIATAISVWWEGYRKGKQEAEGDIYNSAMEAIEKGDTQGALKTFQEVAGNNSSFAALALLQEASLTLKKGDIEQTVTLYNNLAKEKKVGEEFRQLGELLAISLTIDQGKADVKEVSSRLEYLAGEKGVWRFSAMEQQALLALQQGDKQKAFDLFSGINSNLLAPQVIRTRTKEMADALAKDVTIAANSTPATVKEKQ